jgi:hypothetical protein
MHSIDEAAIPGVSLLGFDRSLNNLASELKYLVANNMSQYSMTLPQMLASGPRGYIGCIVLR